MTEYNPKEFEKPKKQSKVLMFIKYLLQSIVSILVFSVIILGLLYLLRVLILKLFF